MKPYELTDKMIDNLSKKTWNKFLKFRATARFDELNVIRKSKRLYKELKDINRYEYERIAKELYKDLTNNELKDTKFVDDILNDYSPIMLYVYINELERKRMYFVENILSSKNNLQQYQRAVKQFLNQTEQFSIDIEDKTRLKAYDFLGYNKVIWKVENDEKVCDDCYELEGEVFDLDNVPPKPHPNCRCWLEPYIEEEKQ